MNKCEFNTDIHILCYERVVLCRVQGKKQLHQGNLYVRSE